MKAACRRTAVAKQTIMLDGVSYLEQRAVKQETLEQYRRCVSEFLAWAALHLADWRTPQMLDQRLTEYFDHEFFLGRAVGIAEKTLAGVKFFIPAVSNYGTNHLPRAHRAAKSWARISPTLQRLPIPAPCVAAICGHLIFGGLHWEAFHVLLAFLAYLRPGENARLKVKSLVRPMRPHSTEDCYNKWALNLHPVTDLIPGKTLMTDETIILDGPTWMNAWFSKLVDRRDPEHALWPFKHSTMPAVFDRTCKALQMSPLGPCLYGLRHGGASEDLMRRIRTPEGVLQRGRWRTTGSLRRYGKQGRLVTQVNLIPKATLDFGSTVWDQLGAVFNGRLRIPPPLSRPTA